jgi:hypothetical protein
MRAVQEMGAATGDECCSDEVDAVEIEKLVAAVADVRIREWLSLAMADDLLR